MESSNAAIVEISGQTIIGNRKCDDAIEEFRGIPYGEVSARWQHSILRSRLPSNKFNATRNGARCPQPAGPNNSAHYQAHLDFPVDVEESEFECLNLFVVRPRREANDTSRLPVHVWIHGGGYGFGASTDPMWNPSRFVLKSIEIGKPIIAVVINYRLNIFGFAASPAIISSQPQDAALRGCNFGLGDQAIALEWIHKNIAYFGGDADKITIGGQSAGGSSSHAHVIEAMQESGPRLFRYATVQSGAVGTLGPIPLQDASKSSDKVCAYIGFGAEKTSLECLKRIPACQLLEAVGDLDMHVFPLVEDGLTIRRSDTGRFAVHLQRNGQAVSRKRLKPMRVLIGDAEVEASIWHDQVSQFSTHAELQNTLEAHLSPSAVASLLQAYRIEETASSRNMRAKLSQLLTDTEFGLPVHLAQQEIVAAGGSTLPYRIQFGNPWLGNNYGIAHHCVELIYLFDCFHEHMNEVDQIALEKGERGHLELVDAVQRFWLDFITHEEEEEDMPASSAKGVIFAADRSMREGNVVDEGRRQRLEVIQQNYDQMRAVVRHIVGVTVGE